MTLGRRPCRPRRGRSRVRRLHAGACAAAPRRRPCRRRRQPAVLRARERSARRPRRIPRGIDRRRRDPRRAARRDRADLPPGDLPRQPELDRRPARRPREQHPDHVEAARTREGPPRACRRSSTRQQDARSPRRPSTRPRPPQRMRRCRSGTTARTRSPRSWASSTPTTTSCAIGVPTVKARFQNVYGPGEVLGAGRWRGTPHTIWRNVTPTFVYKALKGEALPVESGGVATRDFIYVDDIVAGLLACAQRGEPGGVYNLASGVETSILELAEVINELAGNATPIALSGARDWDRSGRRHGDPAKARAELDFEARDAARRRARADDRVDPREPRLDRELHGAPRGAHARAGGALTMAVAADRPVTGAHEIVIEPERGFALPRLRELWDARDLVGLLVRRDVSVRYRQTAVGALWAVVQPVGLAAVFSIFLGRLAKVPSATGIPYPLYALSGMVMWLYFQQALTKSSESTVAAAPILTKVYFPRLAIPLVAVDGPGSRLRRRLRRRPRRDGALRPPAGAGGARRARRPRPRPRHRPRPRTVALLAGGALPRRPARRALPAAGRPVHHPDRLSVRPRARPAPADLRPQPARSA